MSEETIKALEGMRIECLDKLGTFEKLDYNRYEYYHNLLLECETILENNHLGVISDREKERAEEIKSMWLKLKGEQA